VAASVQGGVLTAQLDAAGTLDLRPSQLPPQLVLVALYTGRAASTPELLKRVFALRDGDPKTYARWMNAQAAAAEEAAQALKDSQAEALVRALDRQCHALEGLGHAAGVDIIDGDTVALRARAHEENATVLTSGAGAGDIVLFASTRAMTNDLRALSRRLGYRKINLGFGASGLRRATQ
jgi:phosphomevalonate kinase